MRPGPLVSVITIFLDAERFLAETLRSIFAQTYDHWELLLVDDGSTDRSRDMARRCADEHPGRVRYLEHPGHLNRGMSPSRNVGLVNARGDYVAFVDSDDVWLPTKLERQVALLESHAEASLVYGRSQYWHSWDETGEFDVLPEVGLHIEPNSVVKPPSLLVLNRPLGEAPAPCPSDFLFRRAVFDRTGGFEESFTGIRQVYEDQAFLAKVYLGEKVYVCDEFWDRYRVHADSCVSTVTNSGNYHQARRFFLEWLERYLRQRRIEDGEVRQALEMAFWAYRPASRVPILALPPLPAGDCFDAPRYEGCHDVATCERISGWVWDAARPERVLDVSLYDGDTLLGAVRANRFRRDLREAGKGDGYHAFSCFIPPALKDGEQHWIRAVVVDSDFELSTTPRCIRCAPEISPSEAG